MIPMRKLHIFVCLFLLAAIYPLTSAAQTDTPTKKPTNLISIAIQLSVFRLNYYDANFFNNPNLKLGGDASVLYGKVFKKSWVNKIGVDMVFNSGKFFTGKTLDKKYINEAFIRVPEMIVKKFQIECNDCFLNPALFVEFGGYLSCSLYQSTYIQDEPTGLSSLDNRVLMGYLKGGFAGGLGLSFLSNNFGRHVLGMRIYSDQLMLKEYKTTSFKPNYTAFNIYYNIANISW